MALTRRATPLPLPGSELQRMKHYLSPHYGSEVWDHGADRILVIRVPSPEPDLVNDLEAAVEHLASGDLQGLTGCLLVGAERSLAVAPQPLRDLMARRQEADRRHAARLRRELPAPAGLATFRAPDDPRRLWRLGIRVPKGSVRDLDDDDLARITEEVGPRLGEPAYAEAVAVYLVATQDDVRLDPDLFFQDIRSRYDPVARAREEEERLRATEEANRRRREEERATLLKTLQERFPRVAVAPVKTPPAAVSWEAEAGLARIAEAAAPLPAPPSAPPAVADPPEESEAPPVPPSPLASPPLAVPPAPARPAWGAPLAERLEEAGYDVLWDPGVAGHAVDLAAEREGDYPQRVIVRLAPRLTPGLAEEVLAAARDLGADLALAVAPEADDEARKRLIATKAKWVAPDALGQLLL